MMGMPGIQELLIIAVIAFLLFGSRLPKVMGSLGQGITEFKKGVQGLLPDEFTPAARAHPEPQPLKPEPREDRFGDVEAREEAASKD